MPSEIYAKKDGTDAIIYSKTSASNEEGSWEKTSDSWEAFGDDSNYGIGGFSKDSIKAVYNDEKTKAYVLELNPGSYEGLDSVLDNTLNENNSMGMDFNLDKAHMYMSVDDGLGIIGIYADLKDAMKLDYEDMDTKISDFYMSITYKSINEALDIKIPDEALKADETGIINSGNSILDDPSDIITETKESSPAAANLSADSSQLKKLAINGKEVVLPCKVSDLTAVGLTLDDSGSMEPGAFDSVRFNRSSDGESISAYVSNDTDSTLDVNDCTVKGIYYSSYSMTASTVSVSGFDIGAKKDDIIKTFGNPSSTYSSDVYSSITYETDDFFVEFSFTDDILDDMSISVY